MSIESMERFSNEIRKIIDYYSSEFNITYAEAIGVLQMMIMDMHAESWEAANEEEDEGGKHIEEGD
jgi:hypothetical protein